MPGYETYTPGTKRNKKEVLFGFFFYLVLKPLTYISHIPFVELFFLIVKLRQLLLLGSCGPTLEEIFAKQKQEVRQAQRENNLKNLVY